MNGELYSVFKTRGQYLVMRYWKNGGFKLKELELKDIDHGGFLDVIPKVKLKEKYKIGEAEYTKEFELKDKVFSDELIQESLSLNEFSKELTGKTYDELCDDFDIGVSCEINDSRIIDGIKIPKDSKFLSASLIPREDSTDKNCKIDPSFKNSFIGVDFAFKDTDKTVEYSDSEGDFLWAYYKAKDDYLIRRKCWEPNAILYFDGVNLRHVNGTNLFPFPLVGIIEATDWEVFKPKDL